jgi:hypothetical protein
MMGLPGFEPGSITPEATSLDQTSRQPLSVVRLQALFSFRSYRNKYSSALSSSHQHTSCTHVVNTCFTSNFDLHQGYIFQTAEDNFNNLGQRSSRDFLRYFMLFRTPRDFLRREKRGKSQFQSLNNKHGAKTSSANHGGGIDKSAG